MGTLYTVWGIIFGELTREYGRGFKVTTIVGQLALNHIGQGLEHPEAINDNIKEAA